jgi:hypothetical protein
VAQVLDRVLRLGQSVMPRLGVDLDRLAQAWERLTPGLGQQGKLEGGELLAAPHVLEWRAIRGALLIDEGYLWGGRAHADHGAASLRSSQTADGVPQMTEDGL